MSRDPFLRQIWRNLLFLHWPIEPSLLQATLPPRLEIDTFDGRGWLSLVPFEITESFAPRAGIVARLLPARRFREVNLRTYVTGPDGTAGVWFYSLDAESLAAVAGARLLYRLPYFPARFDVKRTGESARYAMRRTLGGAASCEIDYEEHGLARCADHGSLDYFLLERYHLYAFRRGELLTASVAHTPYRYRSAVVSSLEESVTDAAGFTVGDADDRVHAVGEVDVAITRLVPVQAPSLR